MRVPFVVMLRSNNVQVTELQKFLALFFHLEYNENAFLTPKRYCKT